MRPKHSLEPVFARWEEFQRISGIRHIETERDYQKATAIADALADDGAMGKTHRGHSLFLVMADLIYAYDQRHYRQPAMHGVDLLRFLMEQHGLRQGQLPEVGTQSVVSEILAGKRELTVNHIRGLAKRFGLSPAAFF